MAEADRTPRPEGAAAAEALLERDRPGAEALHLLGYCRFKLKEHAKAAEAFQAYLAEPARTPRGSDTAFDLACWLLLAQGKAAETLARLGILQDARAAAEACIPRRRALRSGA